MYHESKLSNGQRIISHEMKDRESVGIGIIVGAGGRYEDNRIKGAAHFLEHILFKGSKKYSCEDIKEQIEGVGGSLNAFTTEELTCYYAKFPAKHLDNTFDILSDMILNPLILKDDVRKEGTVIIEEIKMYHDLPQFYVMELLDEMMWPKHPLGKNLAGTVESVSRMTQTDLKAFHRQNYRPGNIVVSACGRLKHDHLTKIVQKKFDKIKSTKRTSFKKADNSQLKPKLHSFRKNTEQMHLALGMLGLNIEHKDKYILMLLNIILGGNMSSRLFNEVREKRGLAYSISSGIKSLKDTGLLLIRAGVDNKKLVEAVNVILSELHKLKNNGVTNGEFIRAKDYYLGQVMLGLEDTLDHMLWIGESTICCNKTRKLQDIIKEVDKIKIGEVKRLAGQIFNEKRYNLAVVGPMVDSQEKELRSLMGE